MPLAVILPLLLFMADAPIQVVGYAWAPFISPMGEPFRAKTKADNTLAMWFYQADRNRDGNLTPDEMLADAERFFGRLDTDGNGQIEPPELVVYEWELAPEIQVNSRWRNAPGQPAPVRKTGAKADGRSAGEDIGGLSDPLQGAARYALINMPQPVAAADTDFNRAITLAEFKRAATERFALLDTHRQGRLALVELQALAPPPKGDRKTRRRSNKSPDARVGVPLPNDD